MTFGPVKALDPTTLPIALFWHQRAHEAPVMRFFRQVVLDALAGEVPRRGRSSARKRAVV